MEWYYITYIITWHIGLSFLGTYLCFVDVFDEPYTWDGDDWMFVIAMTTFSFGIIYLLFIAPLKWIYKKSME